MPKFVLCVSWLAAALAVLLTVVWVGIVADGNYCWSAFAFTMSVVPLSGGILLLGVIPSGILYFRKGQRRDRMSLLLAGCSFIVVIVEITSLWIIPMRGE
jgi:hypothetical protein